MPTKPARARKWLEQGKAVKRWSDLGAFSVQLVGEPSGRETQDVVVGIDPGKQFSGIGVQSARFTLFMAHLLLPFETVKKRMEQRRTMRRTRRSRRINRKVKFKIRNHRQKRFDNRIGKKLPPSIRANRQLELRVVRELTQLFPVSRIIYEMVKADVDLTSGRRRARSGIGFSPVMVGQRWMLTQLAQIAPVSELLGWQTSQVRRQLGLPKSKNKANQSPDAHAVDGVALACSEFISFEQFHTVKTHGRDWVGSVQITESLFKVLRRPPICRRQLHLLQPAKGGVRRSYGGTVTRHGFRKGDLVRAEMAGRSYVGFVSGGTAKQISVSDCNWKRLGQFAKSKVELIRRSSNLLVSGSSRPRN